MRVLPILTNSKIKPLVLLDKWGNDKPRYVISILNAETNKYIHLMTTVQHNKALKVYTQIRVLLDNESNRLRNEYHDEIDQLRTIVTSQNEKLITVEAALRVQIADNTVLQDDLDELRNQC